MAAKEPLGRRLPVVSMVAAGLEEPEETKVLAAVPVIFEPHRA